MTHYDTILNDKSINKKFNNFRYSHRLENLNIHFSCERDSFRAKQKKALVVSAKNMQISLSLCLSLSLSSVILFQVRADPLKIRGFFEKVGKPGLAPSSFVSCSFSSTAALQIFLDL